MSKNSELNEYKNILLQHKTKCEKAIKSFKMELEAIFTTKQIEEMLVINTEEDYLTFVVSYKTPVKVKELFYAVLGENENTRNAFEIIPLVLIDLNKETLEKVDTTLFEKQLDVLIDTSVTASNDLTKITSDLNKCLYTKGKIYNFFNKTKSKLEKVNLIYSNFQNDLKELREFKVYFTDRNKNGVIKTFKEEFECNLVGQDSLTVIKFNDSNEGGVMNIDTK